MTTTGRHDDEEEVQEWNFDGLIGPTHHYGGLSVGNVASQTHRARVSHPREAALQGLAKMRALADLGVPQAVVPPLERPAVHVLRGLGFTGSSDEAVLHRAARDAPDLLGACVSASSMWAANAGTVTPSADSGDGRVHFTPANLARNFHRAIEAPDTAELWGRLLPDPARFTHHPPLGGGSAFADEGAANHTRFCPAYGQAPGLHLFVFGESAFQRNLSRPRHFPARQTREASQAVARLHGVGVVDPGRAVFAQQNPAAVDAGVFHNDVIATGNGDVFLFHAEAFVETPGVVAELCRRYRALHPDADPLRCLEVRAVELSLEEAVRTYLFNSQLVTLPPTKTAGENSRSRAAMALVAPAECRESPAVSALIARWVADPENPIRDVRFLDLRGSMRNGGGPACLRQRVVLSRAEAAALPPGIRFDATLHERLGTWVRRHYRETLTHADLASSELMAESRAALDELTRILGLPSLYPFQCAGA